MSQTADAPSPDLFLQSVTGYQRTEAIRAAVELDLFTAIAEGQQRGRRAGRALLGVAEGRARAVRLSDRRRLPGQGDGRYALTPSTAKFLDRRSPRTWAGRSAFC